MKKNVGDLDAYIRLTGGLTMLGIGVAKKSTPTIAFGAMKVAEGVTRFCPMLYLLGLSTNGTTSDKGINLKFTKDFSEDVSTE